MKKSSKFICPECGLEHSGWPALTFRTPTAYNQLTDQEIKEYDAEVSDDFCIIRYPDQIDRFIRVTLTQKVLGEGEDLDYGLWVSLSEKSFIDYKANFKSEDHQAEYFGWICNNIPQYSSTLSIPTTVVCRTSGERPEIFPHKDFDHDFVRDYYKGISAHEAQNRVDEMNASL